MQKQAIWDDRLIETLKSTPAPTAESTIVHLSNALTNFVGNTPPHDDITMLSIAISTTKKEILNPLVISFQNDINELIKLRGLKSLPSTTALKAKTKKHQFGDGRTIIQHHFLWL